MMNKKLTLKIAIGSSVTIGLIATAALLNRGPSPVSPISLETAEVVTTATEAKSKLRPRSQTEPVPAPVILTAELKEAYQVPEGQRTALESFARLNSKVFMSDSEKDSTKNLLNDDNFLLSLADLLKGHNSAEAEFKSLQNSALDLLLKSALDNPNGIADQVLMDIVTDNQIENPNMPETQRKAQAGIKAEVMYLWSAQSPDASIRIASSLAGPVSQKIWENVMATQEANHQESLAESTAN